MKSFRIIGSPLIKASAIVPGPAYKHEEQGKTTAIVGSTDTRRWIESSTGKI